MTNDEYTQLLSALKKIDREKASLCVKDFFKHMDRGDFSREQLVDMYNAIVQRLLSPE